MFQGFSPETIDFLWGIRMNNNREWFLAHKQDYVEKLYEPMKALGQDLFAPFLDRPGNLLKVSRIYRDARLHHPVPYKESLWICIRQDVQWWAENPCLCFEICPDGIRYGFIWIHPKADTMESFRQHLLASPDEFIALTDKTEQAVGMPITASCYRRPKPVDDPRLERFFAWKNNIACLCNEPISEQSFGPELGHRAGEMLQKLIPLYEYCNHFHV